MSELVAADPDGSYRRAAAALTGWRERGWLVAVDGASRLVLEIVEPAGPRLVGVVGALTLDGQVHLHEQTSVAVTAARAARLRAVPLDISPISTFPTTPSGALDDALRADGAAVWEATDEDGTTHRVRRCAQHVDLRATEVVVADGHHRVAAAVAASRGHPARTLAVVWTAAPPPAAVHRILPGGLRAVIAARATARGPACDAGQMAAVLARRGDGTALVHPDGTAVALQTGVPAGTPSTVELHHHLLAGLQDADWTPTLDVAAVVAAVRDGATGVLTAPVSVEAVTRAALADAPLPPKSTAFRPKPRTGVLGRLLDPGEVG